jgi:alcohol dehydrogenase class IV
MEYQEYFSFAIAGELIFGNGSLNYLPEILQKKLKVQKPLLVSDQGVAAAGHLESVIQSFKTAGLSCETFDEVEQEPSIENVMTCVKKADGQRIDSFVALGGGSVIDLAKAAAVVAKYGGSLRDYLGQDQVPGEVLPIVAIPTTAGTGSAVSASSVLSDIETNSKTGVRSNYLRPRVALLDPLLTLSCPKQVTASTGFDVLAHAVESYTMIDHTCMPRGTAIFHGTNPMTEPWAVAAIDLVSRFLRVAVHQGHNRLAREKMMLANVLAGAAFSNSGVTHAHFISYPVGFKTHAPHGVLLATLVPAILEFNLPTRMDRLSHVAALMGEKVDHLSEKEAALKGIEAIRTMIQDIQLPAKMRDIGVKKEDIPELAEIAMPILASLPGNPRAMTLEELIEVYHRAY